MSPQVRMYSRALAVIGGFLVLASGAGEVYRQKARSRSLQSTGQVFLGVYLICMVRVLCGWAKMIHNLGRLDTKQGIGLKLYISFQHVG